MTLFARPPMACASDIRIGHRGLEYRNVDDSYWLNGTRIDAQLYNVEIQRQIAWAGEQQRQREIIQMEAERQKERAVRMQHAAYNQAATMSVLYGYAALGGSYRGCTEDLANSQPRDTTRRGSEGRAEAPERREATSRAQLIAEGRLPKGGLSLKTSPMFGFLRWRFDSPFAPLHKAFVRWAWNHQRQARAS